jgi:UDP-N-acetylmuramate: L-alanyl-gamma-D-glutamyl-meso-diaminopimelate ligase
MALENLNPTTHADLSPTLNKLPPRVHRIHLMGICGTAMASLAGILKQEGYIVTGSDQNIYPPMSLFLDQLSIPVLKGYRPENLQPPPDLVVVGNVITKLNPEAIELARLAIPYLSLPQALRSFAMKGKESIVIAGTHGKTTTSSLASWVLEKGGLDPSFMIGGIPMNFQSNFKLGSGPYFVIEGDEYDTAFFDKGPKFLHYSPTIAILTSIEFDHADIYRDLAHVRESFRKLIGIIPREGLLIANHDDPVVMEEARNARCPVFTYGFKAEPDWTACDLRVCETSTELKLRHHGKEFAEISTPLYGRHNISNLTSVVALADFLGIDPELLRLGLRTFKGVKRRQEIKGEKSGIIVLDDFAHHPTAVKETILAVREKYSGKRLIAVFEPRSNSSRRNVFQETYGAAFDKADMIFIPEPPMTEKIPPSERFSSAKLVEDLERRGLQAYYFKGTDILLEALHKNARSGDVFLFMSNGAFDNLPDRLLKTLG